MEHSSQFTEDGLTSTCADSRQSSVSNTNVSVPSDPVIDDPVTQDPTIEDPVIGHSNDSTSDVPVVLTSILNVLKIFSLYYVKLNTLFNSKFCCYWFDIYGVGIGIYGLTISPPPNSCLLCLKHLIIPLSAYVIAGMILRFLRMFFAKENSQWFKYLIFSCSVGAVVSFAFELILILELDEDDCEYATFKNSTELFYNMIAPVIVPVLIFPL